jgi:nucleotide-binding universal stress UspA family protein
MKRILVATDGSAASASAEEAAVELCAQNGAELVVVRCWRAPGDWLGEPFYQHAVERELHAARAALDRPLRLARAAGVPARAELVEGPTAKGIVEVADARRADLIVVGAHAGGAVERLFIGSVSHAVLRHAHVPVLVVKDGWFVPDHAALASAAAAS